MTPGDFLWYDEIMKTMIVAYDKNHAIGAGAHIPWQGDMPTDMQFFRTVTAGHAVIMGRNTYQSIGRPLPNRQNIVISRENDHFDGVRVVHSLEDAYKEVDPELETFIIGGGQIYTLAMDSADKILATEIDASFPEATVFFPQIDLTKWHETDRVHHEANERDKYNFDFVTYEQS